MDSASMRAQIADPENLLRVVADQDFEREFIASRSVVPATGFALPEELTMQDLVDFNLKVMGQVRALLNPQHF